MHPRSHSTSKSCIQGERERTWASYSGQHKPRDLHPACIINQCPMGGGASPHHPPQDVAPNSGPSKSRGAARGEGPGARRSALLPRAAPAPRQLRERLSPWQRPLLGASAAGPLQVQAPTSPSASAGTQGSLWRRARPAPTVAPVR